MTKLINLPFCLEKRPKQKLFQTAPIRVEVVYGLINRDCRGMGICKINNASVTGLSSTATTSCGSSFADLRFKGEARLCLSFIRQTVSRYQLEYRFQDGYFRLEEPYTFTADWSSFGLDEMYIDAGIYPVDYTENHLHVDFPLVKRPESVSK